MNKIRKLGHEKTAGDYSAPDVSRLVWKGKKNSSLKVLRGFDGCEKLKQNSQLIKKCQREGISSSVCLSGFLKSQGIAFSTC